jgi:hypothetical protein
MADPTSIDEALLALQKMNLTVKKTAAGALRAGKADKYADLGEYNRIVLTALNDMGVIWTCLPTLIGENFVLAYSLKHVPSGTEKTGEFPLPKSEPQKMGSAITYGRRYALGAVTGVTAEGEDDDGNGTGAAGQRYAQRAGRSHAAASAEQGQQVQRTQRPRGGQPPLPGENAGKVDPKQMRHMHALWNDLGYGGDENRETRLDLTAKILRLPELNSSSDLTRGQADQVIDALNTRKAQMQAPAEIPGGAE